MQTHPRSPSRLLRLAGSALIALGIAVLGAALLTPPEATPVPFALTVTLPPTPTPAFIGTPLPPPGQPRPQAARAPVMLPVMPVEDDAPAPRTPTASPTQMTATAAPTRPASPPVPTRLIIPRLGLDAPVVPVGWQAVTLNGAVVGQWDVPGGGAVGWHETSAPLGQAGNTVLNGHHNVAGQVFRDLVLLEPGQTIQVIGGGETFAYTVAQTMVLAEAGRPLAERLANAAWIGPSADERLTLVTCWPASGNSHRLIVVAVPGGS